MSLMHDKQTMEDAIEGATSIAAILDKLGLVRSSAAYAQVKKWAQIHDLDLPMGYVVRGGPAPRRTLAEKLDRYLVLDGPKTSNQNLLTLLVDAGIKTRACEIVDCPVDSPMWLGKPLTLQLDHVDGNSSNNQIANLMVLCPACHSQTATYAGRNARKFAKKYCPCGKQISHKARTCRDCRGTHGYTTSYPRKLSVEYPPIEQLLSMIEQTNYSQVARELGCSDNAIRKHIARNAKTV